MSKLDKAAERVRATTSGTGETALTTGEEAQVALQIAAADMLAPTGAAEMAARLAAGELEAAPQLAKLEEGQTIHGFLDGYGPPAELMDARTKEIKFVDTWILSSLSGSGVRVSILSSAQLDRKLPAFIGGEVFVTRLGHVETKTGRVTEYVVAGPKLQGGARREWSSTTSPAREREIAERGAQS